MLVTALTLNLLLSAPSLVDVAALPVDSPILRPTHTVELPRYPRLSHRGDLRLWREASPERLVYGRRRAMFVRPQDEAAVNALARMGAAATVGRWAPVNLDPAQLLELLGGGQALELESMPAHRPMLDVSVPEVMAREVHLGRGVELSRQGEGVLVGIIDTGIDLTHPAFLDAAGRSRVVAVWDQDAVGKPPPGFDYGHACDEVLIAQERCTLGDSTGHGTHVAGIVAGRNGLAPRADIAVVRSERFTRLADAVLFLTQLAASRGQPVAINVSVGGHYGAHDGRTPLELYLEQLLRRGEVVVAAAGNDARANLHVGVQLSSRAQRVALEYLPWGSATEVTVEMWGELDVRLQMELELYEGQERVLSVPLHASAGDFADGQVRLDNEVIASVGYAVDVVPDSHMIRHTLSLEPLGSRRPTAGESGVQRWMALVLRGEGWVDGWLSQSDYRAGSARFGPSLGAGWLSGDGQRTVTVPATGRAVIAVGSYVSRVEWTSADNEQRSLPVIVGSLSSFSSQGPTLAPHYTGAKPELVAPGTMIVSARAFSVPAGGHTLDEEHSALQGTSMAAPHVTGAAALLLQANPHLDHSQVRRILTQTARAPEGAPPGLAHPAWGYGKLAVAPAVARAEKVATGCAATTSGPGVLGLLLAVLLVRSWARRR